MAGDWLNYHHLFYFWVVARVGGIAPASRELLVSEPTISGQVKALESFIGERLFIRSGRRLVLTEMGKIVFDYANDIFTLGRQMLDTVRQRPSDRAARLMVGVTDSIPKLVVRHLLEPVLRAPERFELSCRESALDTLLVELSTYRLDMVLSDAPTGSGVKVASYNHLLAESPVTFFAAPAIARRLRRNFPASLDGADLLMPTEVSALRRALDQWFDTHGIRPRVAVSVADSALLNTFGQAGHGVFPAPSVIEAEIRRQYEVEVVGRINDVRERYYAISIERKLKHPAVMAISQAAREQFGSMRKKPRK